MRKIALKFYFTFLLSVPLLCPAQENICTVGIPIYSALNSPVIDATGFGFEIGFTRKKTDFYYLGINADIMFLRKKRSVDIPFNFLSDESIVSELTMASFSLANRFNVNPHAKVKLFFDANLGFRMGKFTTTHEGYFLLIKTKEKLYDKTAFGLTSQFFMCLYFPINETFHVGLQLKTGLALGSPVTYISNESVSYSNSAWTLGPEKQSSATYWVNAIDLVWHFER